MTTKPSHTAARLLPFLLLLLLQTANAQKCNWLSEYTPVEYAYNDGHGGLDSIPFRTRLVQQKIVNDMCCYEFEVGYGKRIRTFCIGIADSTVFTFKNNRFKNPAKLLSLAAKAPQQATFFTEPCMAKEMQTSSDPYFKTVSIYELQPAKPFELFPGIVVQQIHFHSSRGLFFDFTVNGKYNEYGTLAYL
jgi:hypothetical protein